jgi:pyroglutamyl-peptidase
MTKKRILLTGFEPFGGEAVNPSADVAHALHGSIVAGHEVVAIELPCEFERSLVVLDDAIKTHNPPLVLALGQAATRNEICVERVAINLDDARIPDNAGAEPIDAPVVWGGPAAYFATLPVKAMVAALREAGVPASISYSAGTYVCNHVFYWLQHRLTGTEVRSGFVHLPLLPSQAARRPGQPSMGLQLMIDGVRLALQTALTVRSDLRTSGGSLG